MSAILDSLFQPGLNAPMHRAMNASFAGLLLVLLALALLTRGNVHVCALMGIALALWASVGWFLKELAKLPPPPPTEKGKEAAEPGEGKMDEDAAATTTSSGSEAREDKKGR